VSGKRDLFVHNTNWFGMMRAISSPIATLTNVSLPAEAGDEEAGGGQGGSAEAIAAQPYAATAAESATGVATAVGIAAAPARAITAVTSAIPVFGEPNLTLQRLYYRWIHNYRYGRNW
jgi:hypothetical protein